MCPLGGKIEGECQSQRESIRAGSHEAFICSVPLWELSIEKVENLGPLHSTGQL